MRKLELFAVATLLTLGASGVAIAHEGTKSNATDPAAATFAAERTKVFERTCTGTDGNYRVAHEEFRGTVTSADPRLAGTLVLRTRSVIDMTSGLGWTFGSASLRSADGKRKGKAALVAVNARGGVLDGVLSGRVRPAGDGAGGTIVANFRAVLAPDGLSLTGELGGGSAQNSAVIHHGHGCPKEARSDRGAEAKLRIEKGEVSAITATMLSVKIRDAAVSFSLTERLANAVERLGLEVGSKVRVAYAVKGDTSTLLEVRKA